MQYVYRVNKKNFGDKLEIILAVQLSNQSAVVAV